MRTKILLFTVINFVFFFLIKPEISFAASAEGSCTWKSNECMPSAKCGQGYESSCISITDKNECNSSVNTCTKATEENDYFWWCDDGKTQIKTAIGCIPVLGDTGTYDFLNFVIKWAIGVGAVVAFLLMLYSGFMIMTAQGNPERLQAGRELLTSAIAGLILLIFSVFILKVIGVDILGLDNFGFGISN